MLQLMVAFLIWVKREPRAMNIRKRLENPSQLSPRAVEEN